MSCLSAARIKYALRECSRRPQWGDCLQLPRARLLPPLKAKDVPATAGMLYAVCDELKADISRVELKVDAKFEALNVKIHQLALMVEEQNARNRVVLDGLDHIFNGKNASKANL